MKKLLSFILTICTLSLCACSSSSPFSTTVDDIAESIDEFTIDLDFELDKNLYAPIVNASERVTVKPFGIFVTPTSSPVSPEVFYGYHTGADFEIFPEEENQDVSIYSICTGPLILKRFATGYGGVIVQSCSINNEKITVVYGHLKLNSISTEVNQTLIEGQYIGLLGNGYSEETDNERKHLHLGIHKGDEINILGYVQSEEQLSEWINPMEILQN